MINTLLVDDEPLILQGLQALVDWNSLGCELVGTARNGEEALNRFEDVPCDLVITDIKMPKMDGLMLIKEWQQNQPKTKWIVLSGYKDFDYVKQGLLLGIENYLVKPVNEKELITSIEQVKKKLQETYQYSLSRSILRDNAVWSYLHDQIDQADFEERMALCDVWIPEGFAKLMFLSFPEVHTFEEGKLQYIQQEIETLFSEERVICSITPENDFIILFPKKGGKGIERKKAVCHLLREITHKSYILIEGNDCETKNDLQKSLSLGLSFRNRYAFFNETRIVEEKEAERHITKQQVKNNTIHVEKILKAVYEGNYDKAVTLLRHAIEDAGHNAVSIRNFALEVVISISNIIPTISRTTLSTIIDELLTSRTITELRTRLESAIENGILHAHGNKKIQHSVVTDVLNYLKTGYQENLSLKMLGQKFYINPIYLGQLFQKEVGVPFSEYLNDLRISKAKELLRNTHEKAGRIGKKVGYSDATYFYKQFKKYCGVTPNEYRRIATRN